ncbi:MULTISPECIES: AfsR/SARP family transcriptional regulator [Amycolatopsis]|uniref:SARP family transcriptional regulator n=1 Tax=Amycolatopsis dendrobii TaxID=2760662 RepID=A0A7W3VWX8_9PSEU|nr:MULTISPECIES: tetratricopeptide repeat protein [Amycolatopsis]MBB1154217.1 SARP family transcriptional regulator [Amycolatopsis dendrobii]UKD51407.1 NB-ARC domain-containing protein [Amycolatopsis sp. FU40]
MDFAYGILGQPAVRMHGKMNEQWGQRQTRNILGILLTRPGRRFSQDALISWLWDDDLPGNPQEALYKAVHRLRPALADADVPATVARSGDGYSVDLDEGLVDVAAFRKTMRKAHEAARDDDHEAAYESASSALSLWRDEPLPELRTERANNWREDKIKSMLLPAREFLTSQLLVLGRPDEAAGWMQELSPEHAGRLAFVKLQIRIYYALGQSEQAQAHYLDAHRRFHEAADDTAKVLLRAFHDELRDRHENPPAPAAAPVRRAAPPSHPLPRDLRGFISRTRALDTLDQWLRPGSPTRSPAVVLSGPPGIGKTSLAVHWAHRCADWFPGGSIYLDLHGFGPAPRLEPSDIVDRLLQELSYPVDHVVDATARAAVLRQQLTDRSVLVILDDAENSDHVDQLLNVLSECAVIVTSRRRLSALVRRHELAELSLDRLNDRDSLELFVRRLRGRGDREPDAARRIAHLCDGLPLALTLIAESAARRPGLSLSTMLDQLRDPEMLLSIGDDGDDQSLRAVFSSSYRMLEPPSQAVFRLFGHHPGAEIHVDTLLSAAGRPASETRRALETLVALHLIDQPGDTDRYRIVSIFHRYAQTLSDQDHDSRPLRRLLSHYYSTAYRAHRKAHPHRDRPPQPDPEPGIRPTGFTTPDAATQWFLRERTNIVALTALALERHHFEIACMLPHLIADTLDKYGFYDEMSTGFAIAARAARANQDPHAEASTLNDLGELNLTLSNHKTAEQALTRALELATAEGSPIGVLTININFAQLYRHTGRPAEAIALFRRCITHAQRNRDLVREAKAEQYLGETLADLDQYEKALPHYHRALHLRALAGDTAGQATTYTTLAELHLREEEFAVVHRHCLLAQAQIAGDLTATMRLRTVEARLAAAERDDRAALRLSQEAVELAERAHNATGQARALEAFAEILYSRGNHEDAVDAWRRAAAFYRGRGKDAKADRVEERLAAARNPHAIPQARDGERTVAMPAPRRSTITNG